MKLLLVAIPLFSLPARAGCEDVVVHPVDGARIPANLEVVWWKRTVDHSCVTRRRVVTINGGVVTDDSDLRSTDVSVPLPMDLIPEDEVVVEVYAGESEESDPLFVSRYLVSDEVIDRTSPELIVEAAAAEYLVMLPTGTASGQVRRANGWDAVTLRVSGHNQVVDFAVPQPGDGAFELGGREDHEDRTGATACPLVTLEAGTASQTFVGDDCDVSPACRCTAGAYPAPLVVVPSLLLLWTGRRRYC